MNISASLPKVLLVNVLSMMGIPDIGAAARVSKQFSCAADDESLWEKLAVRRYGSRVAHATRSLYDSYKLMMQDDNRPCREAFGKAAGGTTIADTFIAV
jgi:F-box domain